MRIIVTFGQFESDNSTTESINTAMYRKPIGLKFVIAIRVPAIIGTGVGILLPFQTMSFSLLGSHWIKLRQKNLNN
jgi:hypothetical protein